MRRVLKQNTECEQGTYLSVTVDAPCIQHALELVVIDMGKVGMTQEPFLRDNWGAVPF